MRHASEISAEHISAYLDVIQEAENLPPTLNKQQTIRRLHKLREGFGSSDPYFFDFTPYMTPIERDAWSAIRYHGAQLLPQYPIGPYFADFADPKKKIVLECDGADYHKDKARDADRDAYMASLGWVVFRVSGRECKAPDLDWQDVSDLIGDGYESEAMRLVQRWLMRSVDGVVAAIAHQYYGRNGIGGFVDLAWQSLISHCTTKATMMGGSV